jgi:hypothetical protein
MYNGMMHHALISVRTTPFYTEYSLNNFNENLMKLLPGNKIISTGPDHYTFQYATAENSKALMNEIIRAIAEHLQITPV